jgi:hypothetical protein
VHPSSQTESSEKFLEKYPSIGILHPSESAEVIVEYDVHNDPTIKGVKIVEQFDFVCPLFTKRAIEAIGGKFNIKLYQGWGLDWESSYLVRKANLEVGINHCVVIGHNTSATYDRGLDKMHPNRSSYYNSALREMHNVFIDTYGVNWHKIFIETCDNKGKILE